MVVVAVVESLVTRPAATSHAGMSAKDRGRVGITDDLIRVSVGIEDMEDLVADFVGLSTASEGEPAASRKPAIARPRIREVRPTLTVLAENPGPL